MSIKPGTTVYTNDHRTCSYIAKTEYGHIVELLGWSGEPFFVGHVTPHHPAAELIAEITELEERVVSLRNEIRTNKATRDKEIREYQAKKDELLRLSPTMARLFDFLDNKITHLVIDHAAISLADALVQNDDGRYPREQKLITLFGASNGDLAWKLNRWKDGSGSWVTCIPCASAEEAKAAAIASIESTLADGCIESALENGSIGTLDRLVNKADALGANVPDKARAVLIANRRKELERTSSIHLEYLRKNEEALEKLAEGSEECNGPWMPAPGRTDLYGPLSCEIHGLHCKSSKVVSTHKQE